jgi:hypothetical protein
MRNRVELYDPIVLTLDPILKAVGEAINLARFPFEDRSESRFERYGVLRSELYELRSPLISFVTECLEAPADDAALDHLVKYFPEFEASFEAMQLALEVMVAEFPAGMDPHQKAQMLEHPRALFDALKAKVKTVTPAQIALQAHIEHLVLSGPSSVKLKDKPRTKLFAPLVSLRDAYFVNPNVKLLFAYLAAAETTLANPTYWSHGNQAIVGGKTVERLRGELDALATDLEIHALLAVTEA